MANTQTMRVGSRNPRRNKMRAWRGQGLGLTSDNAVQMVRQVSEGFPYTALAHFHKHSGLAIGTIADLVQLPQRTQMRRKAKGRLRPDESERLLRISGVFEKAVGLFEGNIDQARRWMTTPCEELDDTSPLDFSRTEIGAREVEDLIGRLEHGVFT